MVIILNVPHVSAKAFVMFFIETRSIYDLFAMIRNRNGK